MIFFSPILPLEISVRLEADVGLLGDLSRHVALEMGLLLKQFGDL
jgi:hypothetical protein